MFFGCFYRDEPCKLKSVDNSTGATVCAKTFGYQHMFDFNSDKIAFRVSEYNKMVTTLKQHCYDVEPILLRR